MIPRTPTLVRALQEWRDAEAALDKALDSDADISLTSALIDRRRAASRALSLAVDSAERTSGYVARFREQHGADALAATAVAFGAACSGQDTEGE